MPCLVCYAIIIDLYIETILIVLIYIRDRSIIYIRDRSIFAVIFISRVQI
jgi:hypothetical protein